MKKTILALALALGLTAGVNAAPLCPVYEFAELQIFTDAELVDTANDFLEKMSMQTADGMSEANACIAQVDRIDRILKSRGASLRERNLKAQGK